jgi:hypothetical protein
MLYGRSPRCRLLICTPYAAPGGPASTCELFPHLTLRAPAASRGGVYEQGLLPAIGHPDLVQGLNFRISQTLCFGRATAMQQRALYVVVDAARGPTR